jgi:2-dehydro-3-deoxygluconokinase
MIDWRKIFADAAVFHASGIAGAVSKESADATFEALDIADEMGLTLSFDINYRKNLWKYGAEPKATLSKMLSYADVVFADVIEYEYMTDRKVPFPAMSSDYEMPMEVYKEWFDEIHARWPRCKKWLMGMRNMISSSRNTLTALLWDDGKLYSTRIYDIQGIVDSMGVGDAFTAGQLHAINAFGNDSQKILDYALAAATLKYSIAGDYNLATDEEIQTLMKG